jgi:hypothetical protein
MGQKHAMQVAEVPFVGSQLSTAVYQCHAQR